MESENEAGAGSGQPKEPMSAIIPPPNLTPPPPPPRSPMESMPKAMPQTLPPSEREILAAVPVEDLPAGSLVPFNTRAIAAVIDGLIATGVAFAASMILPSFLSSRTTWILWAGYMITRDALPFLGGQSVGKKAMKIKVVTLDGKALTGNWEASLIRNAILLIPFVGPVIELFVLLSRDSGPDRGKRLGDEWGKTKVVVAERPPADGEGGPV